MIDKQSGDVGTHRYTPITDAPTRQLPETVEIFSLVRALAALVRHRKALALWPMVLFVAVVGISLLLPATYTANASFVPQQVDASAISSLAGLASQFGVNMPQANAAQSPAFYADLVT